MAVYQQDPTMQSSELPPETMPPSGYPPSSDLPPDALMALSGMQGMPIGAMGSAAGAGGTVPPQGMNGGMGMDGGMSPEMGGPIAGSPGGDPMLAVRSQFEQVIAPLMALAEAYPMAEMELQEAQEAVARAMLKIAQGVQAPPMAPPVPG